MDWLYAMDIIESMFRGKLDVPYDLSGSLGPEVSTTVKLRECLRSGSFFPYGVLESSLSGIPALAQQARPPISGLELKACQHLCAEIGTGHLECMILLSRNGKFC